jgi:hypothetical protein
MPAFAPAPFPHLDALRALLGRAAGADPVGPAPNDIARSLFPVPFVTAGALAWPWEHAHRVLHEWAAWTREQPDDLTSAGRLTRLPHLPIVAAPLRGRALVVVEVAMAAEPAAAAHRLAALRRLEPELDTVALMDPGSIPAMHTAADAPAPALTAFMALSGLPAAAIDAFVAAAGPASGSNLLTASLRQLGPVHGLAAAGVPADREDAARIDIHLAQLERRMAPFALGRPTPVAVPRPRA